MTERPPQWSNLTAEQQSAEAAAFMADHGGRPLSVQKAEEKAKAHGGRAHSKIGPSSAHRWMQCPGSVRRSMHIPNKSTVFTQEGTAAHEFNEHVLTVGFDPRDWLGGLVDLKATWAIDRFKRPSKLLHAKPDGMNRFVIDEEMVDGCEMYRDLIGSVSKPDSVTAMELRLDMSHIHPKLFGTGDFFVFNPGERHLYTIDYKFGSGVAVDADRNEQLMTYAIGGAWEFGKQHRIDYHSLIIVQPRAHHIAGPVRRWDTDCIELSEFETVLKEKAELTDSDYAPIQVGDWCKFCPVAHSCPELRDHVFSKIGASKLADGSLDPASLKRPEHMTSEQLGAAMEAAWLIEGWFRAVLRHGHAEAVDGRVPHGMKMVEKRAYRRWIHDEDTTRFELAMLGVSDEQMMVTPEPELRSVAQLEKAIGKKKAAPIMAGLFQQRSSGFTLAPVKDPRPDLMLEDSSSAFGAVEDHLDGRLPGRRSVKSLPAPGSSGEAFGAAEE